MIEILFVTSFILALLVLTVGIKLFLKINTTETKKKVEKIRRPSHSRLQVKPNNEDYIATLKIIKLSRKLTTKQLAKLGEVHHQTMSKILNNKYNCNTTLVKEVYNRVNNKI